MRLVPLSGRLQCFDMHSFVELVSTPLYELAQLKLRPVKVAVLDTGIDGAHEILKGRVDRAFGYHCVNDDAAAAYSLKIGDNNDPSGHGTGVAGIVGTLAPNAVFTDYRVLDSDNGGSGKVVLQGLSDAIRSDAEIINVSIAFRKDRYWKDTVELLEEAYCANKIVVASKRNIPLLGDLGLPAELSNAISVDVGSYISPYLFKFIGHSKIEFSALGESVLTAKSGGGYIRLTGTSFSTPIVTAFCALLRGANPSLSLFEIKALLKNYSLQTRHDKLVNVQNPLEIAPVINDISRNRNVVLYQCRSCRHEMMITDDFGKVKCVCCGKTSRREIWLDSNFKQEVIAELMLNIPERFSFHNYIHAENVVHAVYEILQHYPKISTGMKRCLLVAALLHDCGFAVSEHCHEEEGVAIARRICQKRGLNPSECSQISRLILATKCNHTPVDLSEKIIRDADLYHVGTEEYLKWASRLRNELKERGVVSSDQEWLDNELKFLGSQHFSLCWLERLRLAGRKKNYISLSKSVRTTKANSLII